MKHLLISTIMMIGIASTVWGQGIASDGFDLSIGYWMASGDFSWDISFDEYVAGYGLIDGRSRLEWDTNSNYIVLEALYSRRRWFGRFQYATGDIDTGTCWDSDWIIVPGYYFTNEPMQRTFDPSDGENDFYIFDVGYIFEVAPGGAVSIFLGYLEKTLNLRMHDPLTYDIYEWLPAYDVYYLGLASTYDMEFKGFRIGLEGELNSGPKTTVKGLIAYYPEVDAQGTGYWNLRDLTFKQTGDGTGIEFVGSIVYKFTGGWSGEIGYRLQEFEQKGGKSMSHFSDGTTGETDWDKAESKQSGIFLTMRYVF